MAVIADHERVDLELARPVGGIYAPAGVERLHLTLRYQGTPVGELDLPAPASILARGVLRDAVAARFAWHMLSLRFARREYQQLTRIPDGEGTIVRAGDEVIATLPRRPDDPDFAELLHDTVGWDFFLRLLFDMSQEPVMAPVSPSGRAAAAGRVLRLSTERANTLELLEPLPAVEIGEEGALIVSTLGGRLATVWWQGGPVQFDGADLKELLLDRGGYELCVITVRGGMLGSAAEASRSVRRQLLSTAHFPREGYEPKPLDVARTALGGTPVRQGMALGRREHTALGDAVTRRVSFPAGSAGVLQESALLAGEPVVTPPDASRAPKWVMYSPELVVPCTHRPELGVPEARLVEAGGTRWLPILMYHRVASAGSDLTARYRLPPALLEAQLQWLREQGYHSVSLMEWFAAVSARRPLAGKGVAITFDDAYRDFGEVAWPILRQYGFGATLFVPTDHVGGANAWDAELGETVPLLDWDELRALQAEGVELGGHGAGHRPLTDMSLEGIVEQLTRCRSALIRETGLPPRALAYPYGIYDDVVAHLTSGCGFSFGLGVGPRPASFGDSMLSLPRIEVDGDADLAAFIAQMQRASIV